MKLALLLATVALVIGCGGEVTGTDAGLEAGDAPVEREPRNACDGLDGHACQLAKCLALTTPECGDASSPSDAELVVTRPGCVPNLGCRTDPECPPGQRCMFVTYSRCAPGAACTFDGESLCARRKLCVYPDFP